MRRAGPCAFTIMEVMVSIAILAMLVSALLTFSFGLGARRDRLVREGDRGATLARVMDRLERLASTSRSQASTGSDWLEVAGRGVWPEATRSGVPAGPVECTGRLSFDAEPGELTWREQSAGGSSFELVVADVEAVLIDRFDDLVTSAGAQPPIRVSIWLAPVGGLAAASDEEAIDVGLDEFEPMEMFEEELDLPARPADTVYVVAETMSPGDRATGAEQDDEPMDDPRRGRP